jgi:hypothetical protein
MHEGVTSSFSTTRPGGFTEDEIDVLRALAGEVQPALCDDRLNPPSMRQASTRASGQPSLKPKARGSASVRTAPPCIGCSMDSSSSKPSRQPLWSFSTFWHICCPFGSRKCQSADPSECNAQMEPASVHVDDISGGRDGQHEAGYDMPAPDFPLRPRLINNRGVGTLGKWEPHGLPAFSGNKLIDRLIAGGRSGRR